MSSTDAPVCPAPFNVDDDGRCRYSVSLSIRDEFGHLLDGDWDSKGAHGCQHRDTPEWKAAHARRVAQKEMPVDEAQHQPTEALAIAQAESHGVQAEVGVPDDLSFDLSKVLPGNGTLSPLAATLGGLAIVGGVALKVVPSWLRGRTEMATQRLALKAKRMELEQKSKDQQQSGDCVSRHAACLAAIATLEERIKLVEFQSDSLSSQIASAKDEATKLSMTGAAKDDERLLALEKKVASLVAKSDEPRPQEQS